jgi:hypothetical protein
MFFISLIYRSKFFCCHSRRREASHERSQLVFDAWIGGVPAAISCRSVSDVALRSLCVVLVSADSTGIQPRMLEGA